MEERSRYSAVKANPGNERTMGNIITSNVLIKGSLQPQFRDLLSFSQCDLKGCHRQLSLHSKEVCKQAGRIILLQKRHCM